MTTIEELCFALFVFLLLRLFLFSRKTTFGISLQEEGHGEEEY